MECHVCLRCRSGVGVRGGGSDLLLPLVGICLRNLFE